MSLTQNENFLLSLLEHANLSIQDWIELSHQKRIMMAQKIKNKYDLATEWFLIACKLGLVTQQHFNELVRTSEYKYVRLLCRYTDLNPNIYYNDESPMLIAIDNADFDMLKILMRRCGGNPEKDGLIPEQYDEIYGSGIRSQMSIPSLSIYDNYNPESEKIEDLFDKITREQNQVISNTNLALHRSPILDPVTKYLKLGSTKQRLQHIQQFNSKKRSIKRSRRRSRKRSVNRSRKRSVKRSRRRSVKRSRKRSVNRSRKRSSRRKN